jgi:hypothetical protein
MTDKNKRKKRVVDLSQTGIVDTPTPEEVEYSEALEKSKKTYTVDEILKKYQPK